MKQNRVFRKIAVASINFYQEYLSLDTGKIPHSMGVQRKTCAFYPTCSEYTKEAIDRYGLSKGVLLGTKRILRCHPWTTEHIDPVP